MEKKKRIIIALDEIQDLAVLLVLLNKIGSRIHAAKIHNLYDKHGPGVVDQIRKTGVEKVWAWDDAKLYDIPNTVKLRVADINADIITVHATGTRKMMEAALEQANKDGKEIFAVTVLTSYTEEDCLRIFNRSIADQVVVLAKEARSAGIKNIVCSPKEVAMLKAIPELADVNFVVPGIRSAGAEAHDQVRIDTPVNAVKNGATYLVIGRQITTAEDPVAALEAIEKELEEVDGVSAMAE